MTFDVTPCDLFYKLTKKSRSQRIMRIFSGCRSKPESWFFLSSKGILLLLQDSPNRDLISFLSGNNIFIGN
ncbi:hypothetical protein RRG08_047979 [Elysia crispata]|uniref:Uncharacterized protein n=1 Tax=Elysia crispata TaxID=231223 RepID=A0AAE0ZVF4_9GAST|nr:hypothetical protein RRG08_047979 [Elysia crispata]